MDHNCRDPFGKFEALGGLEMNVVEEEESAFEIGVVVPKRNVKAEEEDYCVEVLVNEFKNVGFIVERVPGVVDDFIKVLVQLFLYFSSS